MDNKQDKGFTLVELLIVIVILGILATVTVFAVRGITDQGRDSSCGTDKRTLETAIEAYYAQNGTAVHPTAALLESGGFIRDLPTNYTITAGSGTGAAAVPSAVVGVANRCNTDGTSAA
jgi:general secretion pathway protein G